MIRKINTDEDKIRLLLTYLLKKSKSNNQCVFKLSLMT